MSDPFRLEAEYYDRIWGLADRYKAEVEFLDKVLKEHGARRILDLGCGTGGHCIELAKLGYDIVGLDISQLMIEKAREKSSMEGVKASFILGDMKQAHSILKNANIRLPFDAVISMGSSLAHMLDDESLGKILVEVRNILSPNGVFLFCVSNAKCLRDDRIDQLRIDNMIDEKDLQMALLCYNFRDKTDQDILVWNTIWLVNDQGKIDFKIRTHPLRWYRIENLKELLRSHGFAPLHTYGDTLGHEPFRSDEHGTIFLICRKEARESQSEDTVWENVKESQPCRC